MPENTGYKRVMDEYKRMETGFYPKTFDYKQMPWDEAIRIADEIKQKRAGT